MSFCYVPQQLTERFSVLADMREEGELCDIVLETIDGISVNAHKCVLASASPYFRAMFNSKLSEVQNGIVKLKSVREKLLQAIISYSYCSSFTLPSDEVLTLLIVADQFQLSQLINECSSYLEGHIDTTNALTLRAYSQLHRCWSLYYKSTKFVLNNFKDIVNTEEFMRLPSEQLISLLSDNCLLVANEEVVYKAVIKWVYYCIEDRRNVFPDIICHVRLPFISTSYLTDVVLKEPLMKNELCQELISEALLYKSSPDKRGQLKKGSRVHPRNSSEIEEVVIIAGGTNTHKSVTSIDQYSIHNDCWSTIVNLTNLRYGISGCFYNGCIYISGGCIDNDNFTDIMECYHIKDQKWITVSNMNKPRRYHTMTVLYGLLYAIGGQSINGVLSDVEYYDPSNDKWVPVQNMNICRMYHGSTVLDGNIYTVGGHQGIQRLNSVEVYDPFYNQWNMVSPIPNPRSVLGIATLAGSIYVAGGYTGKDHVNEVLVYSKELDQWSIGVPMNVSRSAFGLVGCHGVLYAIGGFCGTSLLKTMEYYIPGDTQWYSGVSMATERIHFTSFST